jgi:hypothetical protein
MSIIRVSELSGITETTTGSLFYVAHGNGPTYVSKHITKQDLLGQYATTGSNTFYGNQTISGSLYLTGSGGVGFINSYRILTELDVSSSGTSGTSGINGTSGSNGSSGTSGSNGSSGTSGTSGSNGSSGTSGTSGISGSSGTSGSSGSSGGFGYLGSFYDTTNQTGVAGGTLTMSLNNSDSWNNGVSVVSGNTITIANPGTYNIAFSAQMVKTSGNSATHTHIWLSQNGVDVPISASQIGFPSNSVYVVAAWNFFFKTTVSNEYVQLKWEINSNADNAVIIQSAAASGNIPAIPGLIVTVNQVG